MANKKKSREIKEVTTTMKPIKKAKMTTVVMSKAAEEEKTTKAEAQRKAEEVPKEAELQCEKPYERAIWTEIPKVAKLDEALLMRIFRTVGEVELINELENSKYEIVFATTGSVRQAMLLHGRVLSQLPMLTDKKEKSVTPAFSEAEGKQKLSVDLALPVTHRLVIRGIPNQCDNEEVSAALTKFGTVAYIYRNNRKSFGFAAFTTVSAVKRATEAEIVVIREKKISIEAYKSDGESRNWQEQQQNQALQYLRSLVPLNQYVLPSPTQTPVEVVSNSAVAASPFTLTPMAPPALSSGKQSKKSKKKSKRDETIATKPKDAQIKRKKKSTA